VDYFAMLKDNLQFLKWFYEQSVAPFKDIKRKIDAQEDPYISRGDYESEEPPFLSEWLDADDALKLQGQSCLSLLQRSFREYLDSTVTRHPETRPEKKGNWFVNYKRWFLEEAAVDWDKSPVPLDRIEELTIARNCVEHGSGSIYDAHRLVKEQAENYHDRFPDAMFASEFERTLWKEAGDPQPVTIELTPEKLDSAIANILAFATFIEEKLPAWMY